MTLSELKEWFFSLAVAILRAFDEVGEDGWSGLAETLSVAVDEAIEEWVL